MPLTLKNKAALEALKGKMWMYKTTTYTVSDFTEVGDTIIISTHLKAISIPTDGIDAFLKELLPVDAAPAAGRAEIIPGGENYFTELANGLMTSYREIQASKDEKFLKEAKARAAAKVQISRAVTDIARTVISAKKNVR